MIRKILLALSLTVSFWGQEHYAYPLSDVECGCLIDELRGILIHGCWDNVRNEPIDEIDGIAVQGVSLLEENSPFLCHLYRDYIGKPLTQRSIWEIREKIVEYYQSRNYPFVVVTVPRQELTRCVLQIVVDEATLGEVRTLGNCYFPSRWLCEAIRSEPGSPINTKQVFEDIAWLNLNPFRRTDAVFTPGAYPGTTDIELVSTDRWPYRVYMGGDDTGTSATGRTRLFFGFNFGKSVLRDGQISYQFTFAPNWNRFYSHTASARMPMPWRHIFVFYGGYSHIEPDFGPHFKNKGYAWQADGRYRIPLFFSQSVMQEFVIGYDFKETNNNLLFSRSRIFNGTTDISQFMLGYELGFRDKRQKMTFVAEVFGNPGSFTHSNSNEAYQKFRFGADCQYVYGRASHSFARNFNYWWLTYDIVGQYSSANLLPSEQLTMTGYDAVRGFEERSLNLDNGAVINVEIETKHFSPMRNLNYCKLTDELYLIGFFDYGLGRNHQLAPGEHAFKTLASAGPGIRYQMDRFFTFRFDYGFQLWHRGFINPTHSRYNLGMILSY